MGDDGPGRDREPEPGREDGEARQGRVADAHNGWRDFKRLLREAMKLGDMVGEVLLQAGRLARDAGRFALRHSGWTAVLVAGIGVSSPLTSAAGASPLASPSWADWVRASALVLLALGLHLALGRSVRKGREARQGQAGDAAVSLPAEEPVVERQRPLLVIETYDETYSRTGGQGQPELVFGRRRWTRRRGLELPSAPGVIRAPVQGSAQDPPV